LQWKTHDTRQKNNGADNIEFLSAGESIDEVLKQFPALEREGISACLLSLSALMDRNYLIKSKV
jgi:uncharacterized protein (DUF433 family)